MGIKVLLNGKPVEIDRRNYKAIECSHFEWTQARSALRVQGKRLLTQEECEWLCSCTHTYDYVNNCVCFFVPRYHRCAWLLKIIKLLAGDYATINLPLSGYSEVGKVYQRGVAGLYWLWTSRRRGGNRVVYLYVDSQCALCRPRKISGVGLSLRMVKDIKVR